MKYIFFIYLILSFVRAGAQELDELYYDRLDSLIDNIIFEDEELSSLFSNNYQFLYGRIGYENNTYFAGRDIGVKQFNTIGQLLYFHSCGLNLSLSGILYEKFEPQYAATAVSAGYSGKFKKIKNLRYRASYNHYFYTNSDSLGDNLFSGSFNLGATYRKKWGGSRVDFSILTGNELRTQITCDFFADWMIAKFGLFNKLEFEPELSVFFGSEDVIQIKIGTRTGPLGRTRPVINYLTESKFGLMNFEFQFPLSLSLGNFDFELGYNVNIPRSLDADFSYDVTGYFNFSVGYIWDLN